MNRSALKEKTGAAAAGRTWGFAIYDSREFEDDDPASPRFRDLEPDDRSLEAKSGYRTEACARAAVGKWLNEARRTSDPFRPEDDDVDVEVFGDDAGPGYGLDSPEDCRKTAASHAGGCGDCGGPESSP